MDMERRKHERKTCYYAEVDYSSREGVFTDPIKNISNGGVFIETKKQLAIGDDVMMLFSDFSRIDLIRVVGDIIRIMPSGVAVRFEINDDMKRMNMERFIDMV